MPVSVEEKFRELLTPGHERQFIETLFVVENKARERVPFIYNPIQADVDATETGRDVYVKSSAVGFSTERIAKRLTNTLTVPGTNTVLIAYEDFITGKLLGKVNFFYNHLASLHIPGFPEIHSDSMYEKSFRFFVDGVMVGTSTMYIASARSFVAGRTQTIHHLLCDEFAFYPPDSLERVVLPALARIPPDGTCDIFSTPHGEQDEFHETYSLAKEGKSVFTPHFYPWFMLPEYVIHLGDPRLRMVPEADGPTIEMDADEQRLVNNHGLSLDQIRWRRWKIKEMESLRREGQTRTLFLQEFPEDDVSCFLATGDMYYDTQRANEMAKGCYPGEIINGLHVWYKPSDFPAGQRFIVAIDPGQAKMTQSAIGVLTFKKAEDGYEYPVWCARDAGLYPPEPTVEKAIRYSDYYNRAMITWEANGHGLAVTALLRNRRPIYFRKDVVSGVTTNEPGWYTSGGARGTKEYMFQAIHRNLPSLECHDIELVRQLRNFRIDNGKAVVIGADDIHDSLGLALVCYNPSKFIRGMIGRTGFKW